MGRPKTFADNSNLIQASLLLMSFLCIATLISLRITTGIQRA